jgi:hypothetical protein
MSMLTVSTRAVVRECESSLAGKWEIETRKDVGHPWQIVEFSPAALGQLPAPINPDKKGPWGLEITHKLKETIMCH